MEQLKWLEASLQAFFEDNGVPKPLTSVLAGKVSGIFFGNACDIVDAESYYQVLQDALAEVIRSDAYDYDLSAFVSESTMKDIREELGITSFTRAEIFTKSLELQLLKVGINKGQAATLSYEAGDRILRSQELFNLSTEEVQNAIANTLTSMDIVNEETAISIAAEVNVDFVLYGTPLESIEAVKLLGTNEFRELLNTRVEFALAEDLDDAKVQEIKHVLNKVVFGSPEENSSEGELSLGLSEHIGILVENITEGGNSEMMDIVQQHFQQFKFPSLEMYEFLRSFSKAGVLITSSMMEKSDDASEYEILKALAEQRM